MKLLALLFLLCACIGPPDRLELTAGKGSGDLDAPGSCQDIYNDTSWVAATLSFPITYRHRPARQIEYDKSPERVDREGAIVGTVTGTRMELWSAPSVVSAAALTEDEGWSWWAWLLVVLVFACIGAFIYLRSLGKDT